MSWPSATTITNKLIAIKKVSFVVLISFMGNANLWAQPNASFELNDSTGCVPLIVDFTNTSTGAAGNPEWDFGNGNFSVLDEPSAVYNTPGTFTVTLVVTDGINVDSTKKTISVFKNPEAQFTSATKGCVPSTIQFSDASVPGDAPISNWIWDFQTGNTSNIQNPENTYATADIYDVFLSVTDTNGCTNSRNATNYIEIVDPPQAGFTFTPDAVCSVPETINMINGSTGSGNLSYAWKLNGLDLSTSENNAGFKANFYGTYAVELVVESDFGCADTLLKNITLSENLANAYLIQYGDTIQNLDTICAGVVKFENATEGISQVYWDFGDGSSTIVQSGTHAYTKAGNITIMFVADPTGECADTMTWDLYVDFVDVDFTQSLDFSCLSPVTVDFEGISSNAVNWKWEFEDGTTIQDQTTSFDFSVENNPDQYHINERVDFTTSLTVTSNAGCSNSTSKIVSIRKPTALFSVDTASGCFPLTVNFSDKSIAEDNIVNKTWFFGDGTSEKTNNNVAHIYVNVGEFPAFLAIETEAGCTDTSFAIAIETGKKLLPFFSISDNDICSNQTIAITDATNENNLVDNWFYSFGPYNVPSQPGESDINFTFPADTGFFDGRLEVDYNGCISDTVIANMVYLNGPVAAFDINFDCASPLDYSFEANTATYSSFEWTLPGNSKNTVDDNPGYTFATEGDYAVKLIANNNACSDTIEKIIEVRIPNANFTFTDGVCAETEVTFTGSPSFETSNYCAEKYFWSFGDTSRLYSSNSGETSHMYMAGGTYDVQLKALYDNGCYDSISKQVRIFQPKALFSADTTLGCTPFTVVFSDSSVNDQHALNNWTWDFGDGSAPVSYSGAQDTISHLFTQNGVFTVSLTVSDTFGCSNYYNLEVATANPIAQFDANITQLCLGDTVVFSNPSLDIDSVWWSFGDGTFARENVVQASHLYQHTGPYQVEMRVYKYGCADTLITETDFIQVQQADASFSVNDTVWNCYPKEITFEHTGDTSNITSGLWDFGYNNRTSVYDKTRSFVYPVPGTYKTSLSVTTDFGCTDSMAQQIVINGPTGTFSISKDSACLNEEVVFSLNNDTSNLNNYEWDMGDGTFLSGNPINYSYSEPGTKRPTLILYGADATCNPTVNDTLYIYEVISAFTVNDGEICEGAEFMFTNTSVNNYLNRWSFGDALESTLPNPVIGLEPGIYNVELIVLNQINCADTSYQQVTVNSNPSLQLSNDTIICYGDAINLTALGGNEARWAPTAGLSNPTGLITQASPEVTTTYTANITDTSTGCKNSGTVTVQVQPEPSVDISPTDISIVIGEVVQVKTDTVLSYTYKWSNEDGISCTDCPSPELRPMVNTVYLLQVSDALNCFTVDYPVSVEVREQYTVDVPTAFTPNNETNNILYVQGHGIARLLEFRIFNRWGNEVFYTDDLTIGWDGTYQNKPQPTGTYVYTVSIERYDGNTETKKGTVNLIR